VSWFAVMDLVERRSGLRINEDRDLLTERQQEVLGRLMGDEYDSQIATLLGQTFDDD